MIFLAVLLARLIIPLLILRYPLRGTILAIIADIYDINILAYFGWGFLAPENYQIFDKSLDSYQLTMEVLVSLRWKEALLKNTSLFLYFLRIIGFAIFEVTQIRKVLFFFPNVFENFFLAIVIIKKISPQFNLNNFKRISYLLIISTIPKLIHEYNLHVNHISIPIIFDKIENLTIYF